MHRPGAQVRVLFTRQLMMGPWVRPGYKAGSSVLRTVSLVRRVAEVRILALTMRLLILFHFGLLVLFAQTVAVAATVVDMDDDLRPGRRPSRPPRKKPPVPGIPEFPAFRLTFAAGQPLFLLCGVSSRSTARQVKSDDRSLL